MVDKFNAMICVLALALLLPAVGHGASLRVSVERIAVGPGQASDVRFTLNESGPDAGDLSLRLGGVDSGLGWRFKAVGWDCPLLRDAGLLKCSGTVQADRLKRQLAIELSDAQVRAELSSGASRISLGYSTAAPGLVPVTLRSLPVVWAQPFLATLWATAQPGQGRVDGTLDITLPGSQPLRTRARLRLTEVGLDTPDGTLAAAGVTGAVDIDYRDRNGLAVVVATGTITRGELLVGNVYAGLGGTPVQWSLRAEAQPGGGWRLPSLSWRDGGTLSVDGSASLDAGVSPTTLDMTADSADLTTLAARYLSGPLGLAGLGDLQLTGGLGVELKSDRTGLQRLKLSPRQANAVDPAGRFAVAGLDGALDWTASDQTHVDTVAWRSAAVHGLGLGPVRFTMVCRGRELSLQSPVALSLLSGVLELEQFRLTPPTGDEGARVALGLSLIDLDLAELSQRLGWPPFTGTVSGRLPSARYADQTLVFDGGLSMRMFGGSVAIEHLVMERPLGVAPSLAADVSFADLDLESLTGVFGFGEITGRLKGHLRKLRLLNWAPAAFEAELLSDPAYKGRQRISQRAVQDISNIGGSGLVAGIQGRVLSMFSTFGYSRLGLKCRLANNVCQMDGIDSAGDGYIIVKGSGLPRIDVVGFQRRVDWPVLLDRLVVATQGQSPIID